MPDATNATPKKRKSRYTDDEIIKALKQNNGMIYMAAKTLGCEPSTVYRRIEQSSKVKAVVDNSRGELLDVAETALKSAVIAKEAWAVCFTLKTIGKNRGYVERVEQSGPNGGPVQIAPVDYRIAVKPVTTEKDE